MRNITFLMVCFASVFTSPAVASDPALRGPIHDGGRWTGFYVGANAGGGFGSASDPGSSDSIDLNGLIGGGHLGFNWQHDRIVLGLEGDIDAADISMQDSAFGLTASVGVTWLASIRGRAGVATDLGLVYATAGLAWADMTAEARSGAIAASISDTMTGYVIGGGLEVKLTPAVAARVEALHYDFSGQSLQIGGMKLDYDSQITVVRGGVSVAMR